MIHDALPAWSTKDDGRLRDAKLRASVIAALATLETHEQKNPVDRSFYITMHSQLWHIMEGLSE